MGPGPVRESAAIPRESGVRRLWRRGRGLTRVVLRWSKRVAAVALVVGMAAAVFAADRTLPPVARYLDVSEPPRRTDYVLILNGDLETRPFAAAALWRAGLAGEVLVTRQRPRIETASRQAGLVPSEFEVTIGVLRARGVPESAVRVLPGEIASTADEAAALATFLDSEPGTTAAVVTNSFHTRRAQFAFRRALSSRDDRIYFIGVPREGADERTWWRTPDGCTVYLGEYAKLAYYQLRF